MFKFTTSANRAVVTFAFSSHGKQAFVVWVYMKLYQKSMRRRTTMLLLLLRCMGAKKPCSRAGKRTPLYSCSMLSEQAARTVVAATNHLRKWLGLALHFSGTWTSYSHHHVPVPRLAVAASDLHADRCALMRWWWRQLGRVQSPPRPPPTRQLVRQLSIL